MYCGAWCGRKAISLHRADEAVGDLLDLRSTRYPHFMLLPRIWQLRHNFSAYDAAYIVLAERLGATLQLNPNFPEADKIRRTLNQMNL